MRPYVCGSGTKLHRIAFGVAKWYLVSACDCWRTSLQCLCCRQATILRLGRCRRHILQAFASFDSRGPCCGTWWRGGTYLVCTGWSRLRPWFHTPFEVGSMPARIIPFWWTGRQSHSIQPWRLESRPCWPAAPYCSAYGKRLIHCWSLTVCQAIHSCPQRLCPIASCRLSCESGPDLH